MPSFLRAPAPLFGKYNPTMYALISMGTYTHYLLPLWLIHAVYAPIFVSTYTSRPCRRCRDIVVYALIFVSTYTRSQPY